MKNLILIYQQNEEDEEDVAEEVDRPQDLICPLNVAEIEVSKNHPEQGVDGICEAAEVIHLQNVKKKMKKHVTAFLCFPNLVVPTGSFLHVAESQRSISAVQLGTLEIVEGGVLGQKLCVHVKIWLIFGLECALLVKNWGKRW